MALAVAAVVCSVRAFIGAYSGGSCIVSPRNPNKKRCSVDGCSAWAMRDSDVCASHAGRARGGAPIGNTNRLDHGFYSRHFTEAELEVVLSPVDDLADEIALCRVLTGRLAGRLSGDGDLEVEDLVKLASMALRASNTLARLMRDNRVLSGDAADDLAGSIGSVLDQLSAEWGVAL